VQNYRWRVGGQVKSQHAKRSWHPAENFQVSDSRNNHREGIRTETGLGRRNFAGLTWKLVGSSSTSG